MGMTREEAIEYGQFWLDMNEDSKNSNTYAFFQMAIKALEQEPWKFLNKLKVRMKDRDEDNGGEPLNAVDRGYHLAYEHLCVEIDNLLSEDKE